MHGCDRRQNGSRPGFTGKLGYPHFDAEIGERPHHGRVEIADRLGHQPDASALSGAGLDVEGMIDEIEADLEALAPVRDDGGR